MKTKGSPNVKLYGVLAVLVLVLVWMFVWKPRTSEPGRIDQERQMMEQELAGLTAAAEAETVGAGAEDQGESALEAALPAAPELANLLRQLQLIAAETGTEQTDVNPGAPAATAGASGSSMLVSIKASGPRASLYDYLRRLGNLERLFVVDKVSLQTAESAGSDAPAEEASTSGALALEVTGRVFTTAAAAGAVPQG